jgi:hypothetical protein
MKYSILITLLVSLNAYSHGDHSIPGAIPVAPHGGVVSEATHEHNASAHKHEHKNEKSHDHVSEHKHEKIKVVETEIFFEAKIKNNKVYLYALELKSVKSKTFLTKEISEFKNLYVNLLDPRKNKTYKTNAAPAGDHWEISLSGIKGRRFLVHVAGEFNGEIYKGVVQVEKR